MCSSSNRPDPPAAEHSGALPPIPAVLGSRFMQSYPGILKQTFCWGKEHNCRICTERTNFILAGREIKYPNRLFPSLISIIHGHLQFPALLALSGQPHSQHGKLIISVSNFFFPKSVIHYRGPRVQHSG